MYICTHTHTHTHTHTPHVFIIHPSIDIYLSCFHIFTIVNNGTMNNRVYISFQISVSVLYRKIPRGEIAGSYGNYSFNFFEELSILFSIVAAPIYIPTNCACCCSVAQSRPILCDPMDHSKPVFSIHHHLLELAQIHVH